MFLVSASTILVFFKDMKSWKSPIALGISERLYARTFPMTGPSGAVVGTTVWLLFVPVFPGAAPVEAMEPIGCIVDAAIDGGERWPAR